MLPEEPVYPYMVGFMFNSFQVAYHISALSSLWLKEVILILRVGRMRLLYSLAEEVCLLDTV